MKCKHCGADLEADAKFCTNCGEVMEGQVPPESTSAPTQTTITASQQQTPVSTPTHAKKKTNVVLIVVGVIIGVILLGIIGIVLLLGVVFNTVSKETENYEPSTYDYTRSGTVVKTVEDPTGHTITFVEDSVYTIKVSTDYLYDKADEMKDAAKMAKAEDIDKSNASEVEKLATKKAIKFLQSNAYSKQELQERLEGEDYSEATIKYAVEHCGADWDEQLEIEATEIMAAGGMSKTELISLLAYRGFDESKVKSVVEKAKFDYYEQAVSDACYYRITYDGGKTKEDAERLLKFRNYSEAEVRYALKVVYEELEY